MRAREIYLDHSASAPLLPEAHEALLEALALGPGNPSSSHAAGRRLRRTLEAAREDVGNLVGASPAEVVFTAGTAEANVLGIRGLVQASPAARQAVVVSEAAHATVRSLAAQLASEGREVRWAGVDREGRVDPDVLLRLAGDDGALVSESLVQSEIGTIQPLSGVAERLGAVPLHVDVAQAVGRMPVSLGTSGAAALSFSAHKLGGPQGIGALILRHGVPFRNPSGEGAQERGRRSGTEAVALAAGFGAAARLANSRLCDAAARARDVMAPLRTFLAARADASVFSPADGIPSTCLFAFHGCPGDAVLAALDARGIRISTGTACASGARLPSPVLLAAGYSAGVAVCAVRVSVGAQTGTHDVTALVGALCDIVPRVRTAFATRDRSEEKNLR